jgi:hypothetical protein
MGWYAKKETKVKPLDLSGPVPELWYRPVPQNPRIRNGQSRRSGLIANSNSSEMGLHETYRGISANKFWNARAVILGVEPDFLPLWPDGARHRRSAAPRERRAPTRAG